MDESVATVGGEDIAEMGVTGVVFGEDLPDGIPGAKVGPAGIEWDHLDCKCAAGAFLHHGVVNRFGRDLLESGFTWADEAGGGVCVGRTFLPGSLCGDEDVGAELLECGQPDGSVVVKLFRTLR